MTDNGEWDGVDRRQGERRERGPPQQVSLEGLSNGARKLFEAVLDETRKSREEQRIELRDARKAVARWALGSIVTLGIMLGGSIWGAAVWSQKIEQQAGVALDVREYVEQRTNELAEELAANGAGDELTRSAQLQNAVEFKTELEALRRDFEREHGRRP